MRRDALESWLAVAAAGMMFVLAWELNAAAAGPVALLTRSHVLITPWLLLAPLLLLAYGALAWRSWTRLRTVSLPFWRPPAWLRVTMGALTTVGLLLVGASLASSWWREPLAPVDRLASWLSQPLWASVAVLLLSSAVGCFTVEGGLQLGLLGVLNRGRAPYYLSGAVALGLWAVALNGLSVFVAGDTLL